MPSRPIVLRMEGLPSENGFVRVADFLREIRAAVCALEQVDREISGARNGTTYYRIIDLRHSSPATVVIEPCPIKGAPDIVNSITARFFEAAGAITSGKGAEGISGPLLEDLREMAAPVGVGLANLALGLNGDSVAFDLGTRATIDALLAPEESYPGWLRGMLEYLNIHEGKNVFRIYPDFGPSRVKCVFSQELTAQAKEGIGRFVEVQGILAYRRVSRFPHEITVTNLEILPTDEDLPTLTSIRGMAPEITQGLPTEVFLRRIRDGFET